MCGGLPRPRARNQCASIHASPGLVATREITALRDTTYEDTTRSAQHPRHGGTLHYRTKRGPDPTHPRRHQNVRAVSSAGAESPGDKSVGDTASSGLECAAGESGSGGGGNRVQSGGGDAGSGESAESRRSSRGYAPDTVEDVLARLGVWSHESVPDPEPERGDVEKVVVVGVRPE